MDELKTITKESKPEVYLKGDKAASVTIYEILSDTQMVFRAQNHTYENVEYKRSRKDLSFYMRHLINLIENKQLLPEDSYFLIEEIIDKSTSTSSKFSSKKRLGIDKKTYKAEIEHLKKLIKDDLLIPKEKYDLILKLLTIFNAELFNEKQRHCKLKCRYEQPSKLEHQYDVENLIELLPTVKSLYAIYKDKNKTIDALILLSTLPYEKALPKIEKTLEIDTFHRKRIKEAYNTVPPQLEHITDQGWELLIRILKRNTDGSRTVYDALKDELEKYFLPILDEMSYRTSLKLRE